ncbi:MAG TPA: hypothetical protein VI198_07585 [Candidatus Eisenbacteria bacterium]
MGASRSPLANRAAATAALLLALSGVGLGAPAGVAVSAASAGEPLRDEPMRWAAADRGNIPKPAKRDPSLMRDEFDETIVRPVGRLFNPVRLTRQVGAVFGGDVARPAVDVNALDEALSSSWFTNRIGLFPMTPEEVARGPLTVDGPDRSAPWKVVRAKTQGVTSGFNVKDARGDTYVVKFDPPCCPGSTTAAGVIAGRLLHAAGYNVSEDFVVTFRREDLLLGDGVQITSAHGKKRPMTDADLDTLLAHTPREPDGTWRAIASKFLPGELLGPFDWKGRRRDDPFDRIKHENRRPLRGLRMICAWLAHFDVKQHNTQDSYITEGEKRFVKHFLFDFTATLGTGGEGPIPLANMEYGADFSAIGGRLLALGLHEDDWRRLELPAGLPEVGYFEADLFDPMEWKSLQPNPAFANMTERDGYWAAKIVSAFRREQLEAAVAEGKYRDPEAARLIVRMLEARRDKVARFWFDRVPPLDFFTWDAGVLRFHDLGEERGLYPGTTPRYRVRAAACDARRSAGAWSEWVLTATPSADLSALAPVTPDRSGGVAARPFLAIEASVDRGEGWSRAARFYVARAGGRVVAVDR